jgi:predicted nucleic acid-binding protein
VNYLIDTNIISEVRKGERCDSHVAAWLSSIDDEDIYVSVLVVGEIRKGIERARRSILLKPVRSINGSPRSSNRMSNVSCPSIRWWPMNGEA